MNNPDPASAKQRFLAWRRTRPRTPALERRTVRARGLDFALWMSPPIDGAMTYRHDLLWPAFAQWDLVEHSSGGGIALLAAAVEPSGERRVVTFVAAALTFLDASSA